MSHAGVVYPVDTPIEAHGKKLNVGGKYVDRGEQKLEGWIESFNNITHLDHINFPYQSGDVILIAAEGQGANKIEPVLTYDFKNNTQAWDSRLNNIGASNLMMKTSNGYAPHMFPEYITSWEYFYSGAPRPGFMGRFIVGDDGLRSPYWPTSPNSFGSQVDASPNGDASGDIYRLIGGVVVREKNKTPMYAGYLSSAFILPKGTNNNRIVAPGSEDLPGPFGLKARFFLVGLRPGMMYETGSLFTPAVQIDPVLPVSIRFVMTYPDGRQVTAEGVGDSFGTFAGKDKWLLDIPGIYHYTLEGDWQGYKGYMPGLPPGGGEFYVVNKDKPADAPSLLINLAEETTFPADKGISFTGSTTADSVYFAAVMPGAVLEQGSLHVVNGKFEYKFDPAFLNNSTSTYDITNKQTGKPDIKDVVQLSFFSKEIASDGKAYYSFARVIFRGNKAIYSH